MATMDMRTIVPEDVYYIGNNHRGHVVFTDGDNPVHGVEYHWEGRGDAKGGDVVAVPGTVLRRMQFQRMLSKGLLAMKSEEDVASSMDAEEPWSDSSQEIVSSLDRSGSDELITLGCLGPAMKNSGLDSCGDDVVVRKNSLSDTPPVCSRHEKYVKFLTFDEGTKSWSRLGH